MRKRRILIILLALAIFFTAGCGREEDQDSQISPPLAENIFTNPAEAEQLPTNSGGTGGNSISIAAEVQKDERGAYLVYEGGEMRLSLRIRIGDLDVKSIGIHLYVDGQPQPYHTAENTAVQYLHTFPSTNGREAVLDLIFTPITGKAGDRLEIGFAVIANPDHLLTDDRTGFILGSGMGLTVPMEYLADPPAQVLPAVDDRVTELKQEQIDLTASEAAMYSSGAYQNEVEYAICVNSQKDFGYLFSITKEDKLEVTFELKGSSVADFGLVLYLDHQPVSVSEDNLIFVRAENGKKTTVKAEIDLSGFDGEGVFYAVIVPRNYRINQLGGSCLLTILGPYYLSGAESLEALQESG